MFETQVPAEFSAMARLHPALTPWQPSPAEPWDAIRAAHLMNRAGFGGTPEEVAALVEMGVDRAVDALLDFPDAPAAEQSPGEGPDWSILADIPLRNQERREQQVKLRGPENEEARQALTQQWQRASSGFLNDAARWWITRMAYGPYPLQERLVLFWHGHFTSSFRDDRQGGWRLWNQNEVLRRYAAGNFRELVWSISRDPAMLRYLNNDRNVKARPNENYARELMELFTLGIGNYTEDDIKQVARAFTGWTHDGVDYVFSRRQHDEGEKTVFGRTGAFNGEDIIDLLMAHPACGNHVGGKLFDYFVGCDPDPRVHAALGDTLRRSNYELRPLLRVILRSKAFFDSDRIGGQIKSPIHLLVGTCRLLGGEALNAPQARRELEKMGQVPFEPPNVKGWPGTYDGRKWINTATLLARYNVSIRLVDRIRRGLPDRPDPEKLVDEWLARLISRPVDHAKRQALVEAARGGEARESASNVVKLIVSMPEFQLC
jgi:uncharacterized protein (DUF1800 family)